MPSSLELMAVGSDDHCGCRVEDMLINGVELHIHYEDGRADAYLDWGDEGQLETSEPAPDVMTGRLAVLLWAKRNTHPMETEA